LNPEDEEHSLYQQYSPAACDLLFVVADPTACFAQ
jgi:hypothetical protein